MALPEGPHDLQVMRIPQGQLPSITNHDVEVDAGLVRSFHTTIINPAPASAVGNPPTIESLQLEFVNFHDARTPAVALTGKRFLIDVPNGPPSGLGPSLTTSMWSTDRATSRLTRFRRFPT